MYLDENGNGNRVAKGSRQTNPPEPCGGCGRPFSPRGPVPSDGKRFCSAEECQAAKRVLRRPPAKEKDACANCGDPITNGGPRCELRFCMRYACRKAKRDADRGRYAPADGEVKMETRRCSYCGDEMPKRPAREGDLEVGRWCSRADCAKERKMADKHWASMTRYWHVEMKEIDCPVCQLPLGVRKGYVHPNLLDGGSTCEGVGDIVPSDYLLLIARKQWLESKAILSAAKADDATLSE